LTNIRPETLRPYADQWEQPTGDEVKAVMQLISERLGSRFTGVDAAQLLGLPGQPGQGKGSRTFRRWAGGETDIPYAAWAILCHKAGLGIIWEKQ